MPLARSLMLVALCVLGVAATTGQAQPGPPDVRCSISAATHVAFGNYHPLSSSSLDTMGSISLRCVGGGVLPVMMVQFSRGTSGSFLPRAMQNGSNRLEYNLYLDAGRTVVWGDGTAGTATYSVQSVRGRAISVPVYARVPPRQRVPTGRYADSIVMTLLY